MFNFLISRINFLIKYSQTINEEILNEADRFLRNSLIYKLYMLKELNFAQINQSNKKTILEDMKLIESHLDALKRV